MKDSFSVKNIFSYISKRLYVILIFIAIFLALGVIYTNTLNTDETELTEAGKYYKYNQLIKIIPQENLDLSELERFNSVVIPDFTGIISTEDARIKLYNDIRDDMEALREIYPKAETLKDVFDNAVITRFNNNIATLSFTAISEEKVRQYADEYLNYIIPNLENLTGNFTIEIAEASINEMPLEEALTKEAELEENVNVIIMFILIGILAGFIIILLMYTLTGTVRNEFDLKSVFSKLPVLAVFKENGKNSAQAASNLSVSLNTLQIDNYILTAADALKHKEKDYILKAVNCSPEKFDDFVTQTDKFYQNAESAQGVLIATKRFKTEINDLKDLIDSLELNKISIIGFILFN